MPTVICLMQWTAKLFVVLFLWFYTKSVSQCVLFLGILYAEFRSYCMFFFGFSLHCCCWYVNWLLVLLVLIAFLWTFNIYSSLLNVNKKNERTTQPNKTLTFLWMACSKNIQYTITLASTSHLVYINKRTLESLFYVFRSQSLESAIFADHIRLLSLSQTQ